VLERLAGSEHRPELVVTRPDRRRGRGRHIAAPPVAEAARALDLNMAQPENVNSESARAQIAATAPSAVLICAFGGLIEEPLLSAHEMLNVHPSLLPRWRGAAPIERAIDAGDAKTGVSIMRPVAEMDAGPVCLARAEPIRSDDDYGTLSARLQRLAGELLIEALDTRPVCQPQSGVGVTLAKKISAEDRRLDPGAAADALERRVRALSPHVGAFLELEGGGRLQVLRARARVGGQGSDGDADSEAAAPGTLRMAGGRLLFGCAGGELELLLVKPAGGRAMEAGAYVRGHRPAALRPPPTPPQSMQ
jgi:methionyl-tRNA formyltransferase